MSPEQAAGKHDLIGPTTDVWGLGAILYELLTGLKPFPGGDQGSMLYAIQAAPPLPPRAVRPRLAAPLEQIVLRCLAKDPHHRYPSALALAEDLERWLCGLPVRCGRGARKPRSTARLFLGALGLFVFASALIALTMLAAFEEPTRGPQTINVIQSQVQSGQRVELLPDGTFPATARWLSGPGQQIRQSPFAFESYSPCLLELLPALPNRRYRLRLQVQARFSGLGDVGIYFAHVPHDAGGHYFCTLRYSDAEAEQQVSLEVQRHRSQSLSSSVYHAAGLVSKPLARSDKKAAGWRELSVAVTDECVTGSLDGQLLGSVPWTRVVQMTRHLATLTPAEPAPSDLASTTGAGLYLRTASAAFRSFVVEPLD